MHKIVNGERGEPQPGHGVKIGVSDMDEERKSNGPFWGHPNVNRNWLKIK